MASRITPWKKALVTGASRGLGRAVALRLAAEGLEVIGTTRRPETAPRLDGVSWRALDLTDAAAVEALIDGEPGLAETDVLVNNAGFGDFGPAEGFSRTALERHFEALALGPMALCRALLPPMRSRGTGAIVNVTSLAVEMPLPWMAPYNAAKAALAAFTRTLEIEVPDRGISIIDFRPGDLRTGFYGSSEGGEALVGEAAGAWERMQAHVAGAPRPEQAAAILWRALGKRRGGVVRAGSWFQAGLASRANRLLPERLMKRFIESYYGMKGR